MSKKRLNTEGVASELRQGSSFFRRDADEQAAHADAPERAVPTPASASQALPVAASQRSPRPRQRSSTDATKPPRHRDTVVSRHHDTIVSQPHVDLAQLVSAVKQLGKEAATHRFTAEEKRALSDIVYTYRNQGTRTSENELLRIALNAMVAEYRALGENSVLARVLATAKGEE